MNSRSPVSGSPGAARLPGRPRSTATQYAILDGTYRLMATEGLSVTTFDHVARVTGVSKMTIYKWWRSRETLLIDAFLHKARSHLPLPQHGDPVSVLRAHAAAYVRALNGPFGKVQLAVIAECITTRGAASAFEERYLRERRASGIALLRRARREGRILARDPPADLYDLIYGTLFYQSTFRLKQLRPASARRLVDRVLQPV